MGLSGSFFWLSSGTALSPELLVKYMRTALLYYGMDLSKYSGQSFRIDVAMVASTMGVEGSTIINVGCRARHTSRM